MKKHYSVFEYLYRDGANNKAYGAILLEGQSTAESEQQIRELLNDGQWFIAEQVGIPPLFNDLWKFGGGPTEDDFPFHEFLALHEASEEGFSDMEEWGSISMLLNNFGNIGNGWNISISGCSAYGSGDQRQPDG